MIRKPGRANSVYRTIILIPWVTNEVVLALMWTWVLNPQMSIIYYWSDLLGVTLPNFFEGKLTPLVTVTVLNAWRSLGFSLVMILAALSAIPKELEEAALVDGCSRFQRIWYITLPLIRSVVLVMIIVLTMSFFNIVSFVLSMTGGGPMYTTEILSIRLYKETFTFFNISLSSALTTVMLVLNLVFVFIYKKLITDEDYY
ncbi:sugar ABC transporter permease [Clostridium sp. AM58-1XD]|uniref:carbohydrate ABC transporter permease n=1 Tax=Clostridium sp. AM58-1XD TaxID=2292307 RepID=UPI000E54B907|nr:sugar ABC transporter permease [Clostridium sp. AM58-1XD]RGY97020.1 sugar ABC transporter permease [Clostridium sp. AM58-1XD]